MSGAPTPRRITILEYWAMGMNGAMFQMIAHGISSAGMFFMVGVIYDRVHHRNLDEFGGLFAQMPVYSGLAFGIFFAGLGLPGLCGFIGEVFVTLSVWNYSHALAVISAGVVVLTAAYILWALQRVYLGPTYKGPHGDHITPMTTREFCIAAPLLVMAIYFGVFPNNLFVYMQPTITQQAKDLAKWTKEIHDDKPKAVAEKSDIEQPTTQVIAPWQRPVETTTNARSARIDADTQYDLVNVDR
ncbi:MAG: proton-conducting transporter membrane subunit [Pirellulales bacterium]